MPADASSRAGIAIATGKINSIARQLGLLATRAAKARRIYPTTELSTDRFIRRHRTMTTKEFGIGEIRKSRWLVADKTATRRNADDHVERTPNAFVTSRPRRRIQLLMIGQGCRD